MIPADMSSEVGAAVAARRPVAALESTVIAVGLPWPINLEAALAAEDAIRREGAVPATIGVWNGRPTIGLTRAQIEHFARGRDVAKASRRDLAGAIVRKAHAATTVAGTLALAHAAGLRFFATGGIGGVHRCPNGQAARDVSADLYELARTPLVVVCTGAKSILDLAATLELLETLSVPVVGHGTETFPAFYLHSSGLPVSLRVDTAQDAARLARTHWHLGGAGIVLAQPLPPAQALAEEVFAQALARAEEEARAAGIRGAALTPFLLARIAEHTGGQSLRANQALLVANARLAAQVAQAFAQEDAHAYSGHR
jgi:pseudouridine-5'-phosphate glycosidase